MKTQIRSAQRNITTSILVLGSAFFLMGATKCNTPAPAPAPTPAASAGLARKVQLGAVTAPTITLPAQYGGSFDFAFVASAQLQNLIATTNFFSTANVNPSGSYNTAGLESQITNDFYSCQSSVPTNQTPAALVMQGLVQTGPLNAKAKIATGPTQMGNQSYYGSCMIDVPQAQIVTTVNDFSLVGGGGLNLTAANMGVLGGANFSFSEYSLQLEMLAKNPVDLSNSTMVSSLQNVYTPSGSASLTLNLGPFALGPSGYFQTPLSQVVDQGLTQALNDLHSKWSTDDPWYTTIIRSCETYIYINGSKEMGLKVGDVLAIKNVMYFWKGDVCGSAYYGDDPDITPVAYAQVVSLGDNISAAQVIKNNSFYPHANSTIYPGARVYMYQRSTDVANVCNLPVAAVPPTAGAACTNTPPAPTAATSVPAASNASSSGG